ncbi:MAG: hypothetical protein R2831_07700 [Chitinophagaceae bacterium]
MQIKNEKGQIVEEGYLVDHLLDGQWTTFHDNGFPAIITSYRKGKKTEYNLN